MAAAAIQRRASAMLSQLSSVKDVSAHSVVSGGGVSILDVYGGVSVAESDSGEAATSHASIPLVAHQGAGDWHRQQAQRGYCSRLCALCRRQLLSLLAAPSSWLFLVTLGVAAAGMGSAFDAASRALLGARLAASTPPSAQGAAIWSLWTVAFAAVALACVFLGSRRAEGSGVPQLKSLLAGTDLSSFLDLSVALPKALGSLAAHASGLSVGKEGPFVHLTALFARHLWRLPGFAPIRSSPGLQRQMLGAAVAAGVTAVFGTPVGGVLFSIEVTATYYQVGGLWRAFLAGVVCVFTLEIASSLSQDDLFASTAIAPTDVSLKVVAFAILGLLCGLAASLLVYALSKTAHARRALLTGGWANLALTAAVAAISALLTYGTPFLRLPDHLAIDTMFASPIAARDPATDEVAPAQWGDMPPAYASALFLAVRSITTVAALSLPIPCGLFTPVFALGAALGRLFGELAATVAPNAGVDPAMFAVAGAAALASGATHTLSTAVMVFELTRQIHHFLPVLVAVLVAYSVSSLFTLGVYDLLLQLAGLPFLPRALPHSMYHRQARDLVPPTGRLCMVADSDLAACREVLGRLNASSRPRAGSLSHYTPLPPQETSLTSLPDAGSGPTSRTLPWLQWVRDAVGGGAPDMAAPAAPVPVIRSASGAQLLGTVSRVSLAATLAAAAEEGAAENTRVVFLARGEVAPPGAVGVALDTAPFIVAADTPLTRLHYLFATCLLPAAVVTHQGKLVGTIVPSDFTDVHDAQQPEEDERGGQAHDEGGVEEGVMLGQALAPSGEAGPMAPTPP